MIILITLLLALNCINTNLYAQDTEQLPSLKQLTQTLDKNPLLNESSKPSDVTEQKEPHDTQAINDAIIALDKMQSTPITDECDENHVITPAAKYEEMIIFNYDNKDLITLINELAAKKNINIVLPQAPNIINAKVTIHLGQPQTLSQAWNIILPMILDIAGYKMVPKKDYFTIVKDGPTITSESLAIYIGTPAEQLPNRDEQIRYLTYLTNIKVTKEPNSELEVILKDILPSTAKFDFDPNSNALIIIAKASDIQQVMKIITQLDQVEFQEKMEIIKLRYASARMVADLFNESILKLSPNDINRYRLDTRKQPSENTYFSRHVRLIALDTSNSIIALGKQQAVHRIKDFIEKHIDVELESAKSILHIYQLQYLDAQEFEPILDKIVKSTRPGGAEQARAGGPPIGGTERFFDEVIIKADKPPTAAEQRYYGGNKLVIAARNDDWERIKKLIEELDTPQPQVLLEVLITDITIENEKLLGNTFRNPDKFPLPNKMDTQAAHLNGGVIVDSVSAPKTIASDLLRLAFDANNNQVDAGVKSLAAAFTQPGGTVISLSDNDGNTWSVLQILKLFGHTKILSNPHIIATNNEEASVRIGQTRLLAGSAASGSGGSTVQKFETVEAELKVNIIPRISSAQTVNLQVSININEFISDTADNRITRTITTNANVHTGNVLALGGLIRVDSGENERKTPILADIPILGWFFKRRNSDTTKTTLTVFISPTIIEPRLRSGVSDYTRDYIKIAREYTQEDTLFGGLKDPITRWFFKQDDAGRMISTQFLSKDEVTFSEFLKEEKAKSAAKTRKKPIEIPAPPPSPTATKIKEDIEQKKLQQRLKETQNPFKPSSYSQ